MATLARFKTRRTRRSAPDPTPAALDAVKGLLASNDPAAELAPRTVPQIDLAAFARHLYKERRVRDQALGAALFHDPVWDVLLDLYAAAGEKVKVNVTSACAASGAPATSALRYIKMMTKEGLLVRDECRDDARRVYLRLSDKAALRMTELLSRLARDRLAIGPTGR